MKKRMDYLDVAKGIAMFLVVMGQAALAYDTPYWRVAIYSFHMPLFFLVSGVVVGRAKSTRARISRIGSRRRRSRFPSPSKARRGSTFSRRSGEHHV